MNEFYRRYFGIVEGIIPVGRNKQALGYDKVLIKDNGHEVKLEEKRDTHKTGNMAIETWSVVDATTHERIKPGWIYTSHADYIAYCFDPSYEVYMLPFEQLQHVWRENQDEWITRHRERPVKNGAEYYTLIVPVPIPKLLGALKMALIGDA